MKNDDVALIHRILTDGETAFTELVKKYQKQVHALAWRKTGDFHIAEDITQDTFLKVYQRLHTLKDPKQFSGWLYVITTNLCNTWLRKKRIQTQPLVDAETTMTPIYEMDCGDSLQSVLTRTIWNTIINSSDGRLAMQNGKTSA